MPTRLIPLKELPKGLIDDCPKYRVFVNDGHQGSFDIQDFSELTGIVEQFMHTTDPNSGPYTTLDLRIVTLKV